MSEVDNKDAVDGVEESKGSSEIDATESDATTEGDAKSVAADLVAEASEALTQFEDLFADEDDASSVDKEEATSSETELNDEEIDSLSLEGDFSDLEELMSKDDVVDSEESSEVKDEGESVADNSAALGSELEAFESASIEEEEFLEDDQVTSIIESILFATDKPQSYGTIKQAFKGTNISSKQIRRAFDLLAIEYAGAKRGVTLEEVTGGYQLRTKVDNMAYLKRMLKVRTFRVSGPALEVLSIVAYKQPCIKSDVDDIRGVESGHLMRGLLDRGLMAFAGKSELPGKPMYYQTTRKFLEIFGLRSLKELPSLSEIDELIPEGIDDVEEKKTLDMLTEDLSENEGTSYSEGEEELGKITDKLSAITTTTDFFEQEKQRVRNQRDLERAQDIREALVLEDEVPAKDIKWLDRYEAKLKEIEDAKTEATKKEESTSDGETTLMADGGEGSVDSLDDINSASEEVESAEIVEVKPIEGEVVEDHSLIGTDERESTPAEKPRFDEANDSWAKDSSTEEVGLDHDVEFDLDVIEASSEDNKPVEGDEGSK